MITLNSDRLVFNSKGTDIFMFAKRNLNLAATEEINLELGVNAFGGRITFGDADTTNPMVLGSQLEDLFEKIFSTISNFSNTLSNVTGVAEIGDAAKVMLSEIDVMRTDMLPKILSDTVYITENRNEELEDIESTDIEGD